MISSNDLEWFAARLSIAIHETRRLTPEMLIHETREALKDIPGYENLEIEFLASGHQRLHIDGKVLDVGPAASNAEIIQALKNTLVRTENTKVIAVASSAIERIKAKALQARGIAPQAIKDFESDLDGIIGEKEKLAQKRVEAVAPHKEAIAGVYTEIDGLKSVMDLLSNGGPPLEESDHGSKG